MKKSMKSVICLLAAMLLSAGCGSVSDNIILTVNVLEPSANEVVIVCHNDVKTFPLDADGKAEVVLDGMEAAYARLFYGREFRWIYAEAGDRASVNFNGRDFVNTFVFEGEKGPAVKYLNNVRLTALPDEDYALPFTEYRERLSARENDALKLMKAAGLGKAGDFEHMEEGRIRYAYAAPLLMHPVGHRMMTGNMSYVPDEAYYDVIGSYMVEDRDWVNLDEYRNFVVEAAHVLDAENREVTAPYPRTVAQMRFIADRFKSPEVRDVLLHHLAASYVFQYGIDDIQEMENIYLTYVQDTALLADYGRKHEKWELSKPGKVSPDFRAVDIDGKEWTLADFRGRYVYIDMWATWCSPCKREMPYLKELEKDFHDAEIVFLGLSTDRDKTKWEEMVKSGALTGVQLYLGPRSTFQKAYNIDGIPRFILLDKEGRIISNDMSRPSSDETAKTLNSLEGIR